MARPYYSHSTDKLALLVEGMKHLPSGAFENIKEFKLCWREEAKDSGDQSVVVPMVTISYYLPRPKD